MCIPAVTQVFKAAKTGAKNQKKQLGGDILDNIQGSGIKSLKKTTKMFQHSDQLKKDRVEEFQNSNKKKKKKGTLLTSVGGLAEKADIGRKSLLGQ